MRTLPHESRRVCLEATSTCVHLCQHTQIHADLSVSHAAQRLKTHACMAATRKHDHRSLCRHVLEVTNTHSTHRKALLNKNTTHRKAYNKRPTCVDTHLMDADSRNRNAPDVRRRRESAGCCTRAKPSCWRPSRSELLVSEHTLHACDVTREEVETMWVCILRS